MIPWEGHALNCTDTTVVSLLDASFLAYTFTHVHVHLTPLAHCFDLLFRLVRQKAMYAVDIPENVVRYSSRLVPYHIAIKMEVYLPLQDIRVSITKPTRVGLIRELISLAFIRNFRVAIANISRHCLRNCLPPNITT